MSKRTCPSCGGDDHLRSSSKKCRVHVTVQGDSPPRSPDAEWKFEDAGSESVIKLSLRSVLRDERLLGAINGLVEYWTLTMHDASLIANDYVVDMCARGEAPPIFDTGLMYTLLAVLCGDGKKNSSPIANYVRDGYLSHVRPRRRQAQQRSYMAKTYATCVAQHVKRHHDIAAKRYVTWVLEAAGLAARDALQTANRLAAELAKDSAAPGNHSPVFPPTLLLSPLLMRPTHAP